MLAISGSGKQLLHRGNPKPVNTEKKEKKKLTLPAIVGGNSKRSAATKKKISSRISTSNNLQVRSPEIIPPTALSVAERALKLLSDSAVDSITTGKAMVKFNHYKKEFPIHNGVLRWADVDQEYSISFVYHGNYRRDLWLEVFETSDQRIATRTPYLERDEQGLYFLGLVAHNSYRLDLEEDPVAGVGVDGLRVTNAPLLAQKNGISDCPFVSGNSNVKEITKDLLAMKVSDLHSEKAKELREQRDIEDILFSQSNN